MQKEQKQGPFRYFPEIDEQVNSAVSEILDTNVVSSVKIEKGENNHVYKINTGDGSFVVRVFRHSHWPEEGKLVWIEDQLSKLNIPHAKQLYYSREDTYFPYGLMISEYVSGINAHDAIANDEIDFKSFHVKLAQLLKQVHQVKIDAFGLVCNGEGQIKDYIEYQIGHVRKVFGCSQGMPGFKRDVFDRIESVLQDKLSLQDKLLQPVLIHGDPTPDNCIWTEDGEVILVDWDGANSNIWLADYSWITYFGSHLSKIGSLEKRHEILRDAFTEGYGSYDFHSPEIIELESILHILQAIDLLPYYYFDQENIKAFNITKEKLSKLVGFEV